MAKEAAINLNSSFEEIYAQKDTPLGRFTLDRIEKMAEGVAMVDVVPRQDSPLVTETQPSVAPRTEMRNPLDKAVADYQDKTKPHTAEFLTKFQRILWQQVSEIAGVDIVAPVVVENQKTIEKMEQKDKGIIFVPENYAAQNQRLPVVATLSKLANNAFVPKHWSIQADNSVTNEALHFGYRWVDMAIDAPNRNTTEQQARDAAKEEKADGMNLTEYVVAGLQSKIVTGHYLDEGYTWSRALGSRSGGSVVLADFLPDGDLYVASLLDPRDHNGFLGARFSSGVASA